MTSRHLLILCFFFTPFFLKAQTNNPNTIPDLIIGATTSYTHLPDFEDGLLSYGITTEARLGKRTAVAADFTIGNTEGVQFVSLKPGLRFYLSEKYQRGGFLKVGTGFYQLKTIKADAPVGYPFDVKRGSQVGFASFDFGIGFATVIKEHITFSCSFSMVSPIDIDLDGAYFTGDFSVGYAF